ncbi:MAG: hypothetical protein JOY90_18215 [Bradyrhizobium sp.]|uniref:hypothetical protein n=1 Tax=Bradyrhizobium sp. TaxID=376 RepID=UPI001D4B9DC5|nr:hypothetical protein [Bradyrhizobium sp.]MBV9562357.1 hypothetical protein [Bradyrhizobium sp.]
MLIKTMLATALFVAAISPAMAAADNSGEYSGGFVNPPSTDGVNPVYHPGWFPNYTNRGGSAYGLAPSAGAPRQNGPFWGSNYYYR